MRTTCLFAVTLALAGCGESPSADALLAEVRGRLTKADAELTAAAAMPAGGPKLEALDEQRTRLVEAAALLESAGKLPLTGPQRADRLELAKGVKERLGRLEGQVASARAAPTAVTGTKRD